MKLLIFLLLCSVVWAGMDAGSGWVEWGSTNGIVSNHLKNLEKEVAHGEAEALQEKVDRLRWNAYELSERAILELVLLGLCVNLYVSGKKNAKP